MTVRKPLITECFVSFKAKNLLFINLINYIQKLYRQVMLLLFYTQILVAKNLKNLMKNY